MKLTLSLILSIIISSMACASNLANDGHGHEKMTNKLEAAWKKSHSLVAKKEKNSLLIVHHTTLRTGDGCKA